MNSWGVLLQEGLRALDGALSSLLKLSGTLILPLTDKWANTLFEVFFLFPLLFAFGIGEVLSPTTPGSGAARGQRLASCFLASSTLYRPLAPLLSLGTFGPGQELLVRVLEPAAW